LPGAAAARSGPAPRACRHRPTNRLVLVLLIIIFAVAVSAAAATNNNHNNNNGNHNNNQKRSLDRPIAIARRQLAVAAVRKKPRRSQTAARRAWCAPSAGKGHLFCSRPAPPASQLAIIYLVLPNLLAPRAIVVV
jgi:hypothetical protein